MIWPIELYYIRISRQSIPIEKRQSLATVKSSAILFHPLLAWKVSCSRRQRRVSINLQVSTLIVVII